MSVSRILVAGLASFLAIAHIGGNAQTLSPDAATMTSSGFLFSVDVFLDESATSPVVLGIRDGQTVTQVGFRGFLREGRSWLVRLVVTAFAIRGLSTITNC